MEANLQVGEVSERTGLSVRTIRYYEDVGLIPPASRSKGGFRLYADSDVQRLRLVRTMKPLELTLEEMVDLLGLLDEVDRQAAAGSSQGAALDRLEMYHQLVRHRVDTAREQWEAADVFAESLRSRIGQQARRTRRRGKSGPANG